MNKNFKIIVLVVLVLSAVLVVSAWRFFSSMMEPEIKKFPDKMVIDWIEQKDSFPFVVAKEKGFFEEEGLNVVLSRRNSHKEVVEDLVSPANNFVGITSIFNMILESEGNKQLTIVGEYYYYNAKSGLIARSGIDSFGDLKGKRVAVAKDPFIELLFSNALNFVGMSLKDVVMVSVSVDDTPEEFLIGNVDAVFLEDLMAPFVDKIAGGKIIYSPSFTPGFIMDDIVMRKDFVNDYPDAVRAFLNAYFRAVNFINDGETKAEAIAIGAKYYGETADVFSENMRNIKFLNKHDNLSDFSYKSGPRSIYVVAKSIHEFLKTQGLAKNLFNPTDIISEQFIKELGGGIK